MQFSFPVLFWRHRLHHGFGGVHGGLRRVDGAHEVRLGAGVQSERPGDAWHFASGQHQPQPQQGVSAQHHKPRREDGRLQKCGEAQADDLLTPLDEAVHVAAWDAEHIETAHRYLDEQDAAPFQVGEKHFDDGVAHHNDHKQQHDGVGDGAESAEHAGAHGGAEIGRGAEAADDLVRHLPKALTVAGDARREAALEIDRQFEELHWHDGEQRHRHETLEGVESRVLHAAPAVLVFDAGLKGRHHQPSGVERPCQIGKKQDDGLYPIHGEQLHAHVAHLREKFGEKAHHLSVHPLDDLIQHRAEDKIPYKHCLPPPLGAYGSRRFLKISRRDTKGFQAVVLGVDRFAVSGFL